MKSLQIPEYLVVDDRNAMEHEKGLLADAHEAALCFTGGMSYNPHEMALRIRRLAGPSCPAPPRSVYG